VIVTDYEADSLLAAPTAGFAAFGARAHRRRRPFAGFGGSFGFPTIEDAIHWGGKYTDVKGMLTDPKLMGRFPNMANMWSFADGVQKQIQALAGQPEAASLVASERAADQSINETVTDICNAAKIDKKSFMTQSLVTRLSDLLNSYVGYNNQLAQVNAVIANRTSAQAQSAVAAVNATTAASNATAAVSQAQQQTAVAVAAQSQDIATKAQTQVAIDTKALVTQQVAAQSVVEAALAPKFLGIPLAYWGVGTVVLGGGYFLWRRSNRKAPGT